MSKEEMRKERRGGNSAAGVVENELAQLVKIQSTGRKTSEEIDTLTVGCSAFFSLICC